MSRTSRSILVTLSLALVAVLFPMAASAEGTLVLVNPLSQSVNLNQSVTVDVKVDSVANLYGIDITLTFDPAKLEVQDADGNAGNGVQIASGDFPNPAHIFVAGNSANNSTGQVKYVAAILAPNPPVSGTGVVARITFKAKASGTALVTLSNVKLSDNQAQPISATLMSGSITVVAAPGPQPTPYPTPGPTPVPGPGTTYVVQWGDTLYGIAGRFGVTVQAIVAANGLVNPNFIRVGQTLIIPGAGPGPGPGPGPGTTYVVQPGDTLYAIARRYGVSVQAIATQNGIVNIHLIKVGQVLVIPGGSVPPPSTKQHVVQPGDTIYGIAAMYGVAPWSVIVLNNLANPNLIFPGQVILLP